MKITAYRLKTLGLILLFIPLGLLITLGIGEMMNGIFSGMQHFIQALPIVVLGYFAWKKPKIGGNIIVAAALTIIALYLMYPGLGFPIIFRVVNSLMLFGPILIAGFLFIKSSDSYLK